MLYDGDELVAEYSAPATGSPVLLRRYVHGAGSDDPLIWYEGAGVASTALRRLRSNHQGSIVAVTDTAGTAIAINAYDEWGIPASANQGRFQYSEPEPSRGLGEVRPSMDPGTGPLLLQSPDILTHARTVYANRSYRV